MTGADVSKEIGIIRGTASTRNETWIEINCNWAGGKQEQSNRVRDIYGHVLKLRKRAAQLIAVTWLWRICVISDGEEEGQKGCRKKIIFVNLCRVEEWFPDRRMDILYQKRKDDISGSTIVRQRRSNETSREPYLCQIKTFIPFVLQIRYRSRVSAWQRSRSHLRIKKSINGSSRVQIPLKKMTLPRGSPQRLKNYV